jgi:N-acetylneuraminic acid mutarotase
MKQLMIRAGVLAAVAGMVLPGVAAADGGWGEGPPVPLGRIRYAHTQCAGDAGRFYVISGQDRTFNPTFTVERFDTGTGTWEQLPSLPDPRIGAAAVCVGDQIHVLGGSDRFSNATTSHYVYTLGAKEWVEAAPLPRAVIGAAAGGHAGRVYLAGGDSDFDPPGISAEVDVYEVASNQWTTARDRMPFAASFAGSAQSGRFLYVVGGFGDDSPAVNVRATQRLDLRSGRWSTGPELADPPADFALVATGSALYTVGGDADGGGFKDASATVRRLDLARWPAGEWVTERDALPQPVAANNGGYATSDGRIWSVGGSTPGLGIRDVVYVR